MLPLLVTVPVLLAFLGTGAYCLLRCVRGADGPVVRVNDAAHVLMSAEMALMAAGARGLVQPQLIASGLAVGWFAVQATGVPLGAGAWRVGALVVRPGCPGRWRVLHHGLLMVLTIWMLAPLAPSPMGGMAMTTAPSASGGSVAAGVYCLAAALGLGWLRTGRRADEVAIHVTMAVGMGVMLVAPALL
jgi:hypothetical protein